MTRVRKALTRPSVVAVLLVAVGATGFALYWFQPWKLWQDTTVDEALPGIAAPSRGSSGQPSPADGPRTLATGELISHEHETSGTAKLVRLADGSHVLRLENLATSSGPDLRVWLTDAPVQRGPAGWRVFDDGEYVSLGALKGNKGNQNYALPRDVDPAGYSSVSIWCDRFDVSFGAAELARA
ncbi:DM13 domain-containing protein [Streptomyces sp. NPDC002309]